MAKCIYCGKDAGWFNNAHKECKAHHEAGIRQLQELLASCFQSHTDFYLKATEVQTLIREHYLKPDDLETLYTECLDQAMQSYLNDGLIDGQEKATVARFLQFTELPAVTLNRNGAIEQMLQAEVLADIINGRTPAPKITIQGNFPFLLQKNEHLVWLFRSITFYEQKVKREYRGRSSGMSFRICKGGYYRTGGFKGHPVETTYMQRIGTGDCCLTNRHLYFASPEKSIKIPFKKIMHLDSYSNGLGVNRDGANAKPLFFEGLNSWFCHNVISNLAGEV